MNLSDEEHERLALLMEEMGEAIQVIGKIYRHGYVVGHPERTTTNREDLEKELGDVFFAVDLMLQRGDVQLTRIQKARDDKLQTVEEYLNYNNLDGIY